MDTWSFTIHRDSAGTTIQEIPEFYLDQEGPT